MAEWTTCGECGRVVYVMHTNRHGNCVLCQPEINGVDVVEFDEQHDEPEESAGTDEPAAEIEAE